VWGKVKKTSREESELYFATRPRGSQLGAWASAQSKEIPSRQALLKRVREAEKKFPNQVPCPKNRGGYILDPIEFEFWTLQEDRLHDRVRFKKTRTGWQRKLLNP